MRRLDRLSDEDARILRLEAGAIRGHTCKVVVTGPAPNGELRLSGLRSHVAARLDRFPRLRRRLAPTPLRVANPIWVDDPAFEVGRHVVDGSVGQTVDARRLRHVVAGLMTQRLERDRPLWRIDLVGPLEDGGVALVVRLHHCLADGMTAMRIVSEVILDGDPPEARPAESAFVGAPGASALFAIGARDRIGGAAAVAWRGARMAASRDAWGGAVGTARRMPGTLRRELLPGSARSPLDAIASPGRAVAFVSRPFEDLHRVAKAFPGVKINDVVLAAVAGGLRESLGRDGGLEGGLRAKVPVSLHRAGEAAGTASNRDSFMVVDLALQEPDPQARLEAISAATQDRKRHHDAEEIDALLHDLGHLSRPLERLAERWVARPRLFAVNVSNVPGPVGPLSVLGAPVHEIHSLAEVANRHALRVSALSSGGKFSFGLCADAAVMADLDPLAWGIERELDELLGHA